jgi:hypothetical protein
MHKLTPIIYLIVASLLGIVAVLTFIAMVRALTVQDTLSAVESALGTGVLTILLAVMANRLFKAGWQRLRSSQPKSE